MEDVAFWLLVAGDFSLLFSYEQAPAWSLLRMMICQLTNIFIIFGQALTPQPVK